MKFDLFCQFNYILKLLICILIVGKVSSFNDHLLLVFSCVKTRYSSCVFFFSGCTLFTSTAHFLQNFLSVHTMILKPQEMMLHEYFEKSSLLTFPSPPILGFCVFPHTKREHAITFCEIKILKFLSPLGNFSHGL